MYLIDLKPYFNHRFVYPSDIKIDNNEMIGINNNFFIEEKFPFSKFIKVEDMQAVFERNSKLNDNIACSKQEIILKPTACKKIMIAGFCSWGVYKETFKLIYDDDSEERIIVGFSDVIFPLTKAPVKQLSYEEKDIRLASQILFGPSELRDKQGYIFYNIAVLKQKNRKLVKIILPDNFFMNVYAITLN